MAREGGQKAAVRAGCRVWSEAAKPEADPPSLASIV
jgi:hypothetical protein